ncbi:MAG: hypothetical protein R3C28_28430 [Pirellulaceae bacterium]
MTDAIVNESQLVRFDLDLDGTVNATDLNFWIKDLRNTYIGDANLDGEFSSSDFVEIFVSAKFETGERAQWSEGDWNADGYFTTSDFVAAFQEGGYEIGPLGNNGDFNRNGVLDQDDINLLTDAIVNESQLVRFDLDLDGTVNATDLNFWIKDLRNTYIGDANLDGEFSSSDFVEIFVSAKFETGERAQWSEGDWNADGIFSTSDLVAAFVDGGFEFGPKAAIEVERGIEAFGIAVIDRLRVFENLELEDVSTNQNELNEAFRKYNRDEFADSAQARELPQVTDDESRTFPQKNTLGSIDAVFTSDVLWIEEKLIEEFALKTGRRKK